MRPLQVARSAPSFPPGDNAVAAPARLEGMGFDALWWSDHFLHWFPPSVWTEDLVPQAARVRSPHNFYDPFPLIGHAAASTERVRLGTCVTDAIRRHPAVMAQTWLTLDHMSHGRAMLGIGVGEAENIVPFGMPYDRTASRLIEAVEIIRLLWSTPDPVSFRGDFWSLDDAIVGLEPYGDRPPELWLAAHRPRLLKTAGEVADGWIPIYLDADRYGEDLRTLRGHAKRAGRRPEDIEAGMYVWVVCDEDRGAAERMLDSLLLRLVALTAPTELYEAAGAEHPLASRWGLLDYVPTRLGREEALAAARAVPDEVLRTYYMWGTPDDVVERLRPFRAAGLEHVYLVNVTPLGDPATAASVPARDGEILHGLRRLDGEAPGA